MYFLIQNMISRVYLDFRIENDINNHFIIQSYTKLLVSFFCLGPEVRAIKSKSYLHRGYPVIFIFPYIRHCVLDNRVWGYRVSIKIQIKTSQVRAQRASD